MDVLLDQRNDAKFDDDDDYYYHHGDSYITQLFNSLPVLGYYLLKQSYIL
jgi:hypothetical protein